MRERCAVAMSIFAKYGAPDLFITFTANPKWPEITENLRQSEHTTDSPDLLARVFNLKLKSLMDDPTVHGALGKSIAQVFAIELQKRGSPHAHILIVLRAADKFSTSGHIDKFVLRFHHRLKICDVHEIVTNCLMHGTCGIDNPGEPCMESGQCVKEYNLRYKYNIYDYSL
ncbi:hypothetical protein AVEN_1608-1 [Araneus ventricosus]|uniref:Helitron helicase-like domain-containing protein n=1 Tax=Araneus ventricosus TaxID=182803 RepID=A0A4Y2DSI4_ARAVE|nr:hypothetical protein AVEN_1608-1 [Araneus ventricosus]